MILKLSFPLMAGSLLAVATPAFAQTVVPSGSANIQPAQTAAPASTEASSKPAGGQTTLSNADLDKLRGGEEIVVSDQNLNALTSGNLINGNNTAGNVSISDMAFSNFNGIGNILINTGSQNSLQTGMNLTINVDQ
jgi:hypothetical protein